ncbi:MAG: DUF3035 domain-containing protein [Pseudobdellovibrionaceae bacterium]
MRKPLLIFALTASAIPLILSGCSRVKEEIGLTRREPDEFAVIKRAPLEIPADLVALPIPQPGAPRPQEPTAQAVAENVLFGDETTESAAMDAGSELQPVIQKRLPPAGAITTTKAAPTQGEAVLLQTTGATQTKDNIRKKVDEEAEEYSYEEQAVIDKLLDRKRDASGSVIDPEAEAARLKKVQSEGKPLTAGGVATVEDKD